MTSSTLPGQCSLLLNKEMIGSEGIYMILGSAKIPDPMITPLLNLAITLLLNLAITHRFFGIPAGKPGPVPGSGH